MAQHDYIIADADGATVLADLNDALAAIASTNKGNARPSTIQAGMMWIDDNTPSATVWTLNLYDGSEDIALALIDTAANAVLFYAAGIGIGTSSPIRPLTVSHPTSAEMVLQDLSRPANQRNARFVYSGGKLSFGGLNDAGTSGSATFAIDPITGHIYLGQTTSAGPGIGNTDVGASVFNDGVNGTAIISSRGNQSAYFANTNVDGTIFTFNRSGVTVGSVTVTSVGTAFNSISDRRKKTYIKPYKQSGQVIDALNVVSHGWRGHPDRPHEVNLLAQEAAEVFPAAVTRGDDDPDKREGDEGFVAWAVGYAGFVPVLLAEVKALRGRVAALEGRQ